MADSTIQQKLSAEVLGTFVLVFFGCGSVVYAGTTGSTITLTTIGLTFGLAVVVMAYAFGRVSGAHFNPAVYVGAAISGRLAWRQVGLYVIAQLVGATLGAFALYVLMQGFDSFDAEGHMGQNAFGDQGSGYAWWAAFLLELVLTAIFVTVILAVTDERNEHPALAPLAIGFTLAALHFVAIPLTGTSVNPARSIGPALFAGGDNIVQLWLFILAPALGGAAAGLLYPLLFGYATEPIAGSGLRFGAPAAAPGAVPGDGAPDALQQQWNQEEGVEAAGLIGGTGAGTVDDGDDAATTTARMQTSPTDPAAQPRIVQDGWEWDYAAQQWKPLQDPPQGSGD